MTTFTVSIEQQSLQQLTNNSLKTSFDMLENSFDVLNDIETDDLESIMTAEFAQGMPNDTEIASF
ncbi:hypothetical protein I8748_03970 [Nostoc sp. CENA67]|uniref:Uncharacterized protein n=1 Tax=Amazonocrinis nigriterrae CENA67 TaxID=2794033 RepID=A0A8J7HKQ0_9NOST|nr:hypothetical protein [Amazonocrinis nigriterrae]MBH8561341.1 hypothetical protein [Amazonocrinis nigriterrae CENA67]